MPDISSGIEVFEKHLSKQRLDAFIDPADRSRERTLARYQANVQICEALYPTLHVVEVVVRNHVFTGISRKKGNTWLTNAPDRWMRGEELRKATEAANTLTKLGKPTEPGRMIAELNFGFWTSLFDRHYERVQGADLWSGVVRAMFPLMAAGSDKIAAIRTRLNHIRDLRNRVFHYEPVWHWADLEQQHREILETIGWVSAEMKSYAEGMDRFVEVYKATEIHRVRGGSGGSLPSTVP
jgi:hypothetical protein